jgi:hypothetical protein
LEKGGNREEREDLGESGVLNKGERSFKENVMIIYRCLAF